MQKIVLSFILIACVGLSSVAAQAESSSALMAEAIALLQSNQKPAALKKLEKAFEISQDPDEIQMIGALIIEASPLDYERRGAYLRYLVEKSSTHEDYGKWLKELGDRAFDKGELIQAEDWYLRSLAHQETPQFVQYKLAWVYWNQKKRVKAFSLLLDVYEKSDTDFRTELIGDLSRLWWEIGGMPAPTFKRVADALPQEDRSKLLMALFDRMPRENIQPELFISLLKQLKSHEATSRAWTARLQQGIYIKDNPCLLFRKLLEPGNLFPPEMLLLCLRADKPIEDHRALSFLEKMDHSKDEKLAWAQAELLEKRGDPLEGAYVMMEPTHFNQRSKAYLQYLEQLLLYLKQENFETAMNMITLDQWKKLMEALPSSPLLARLQALDPQTWIAFEEKQLVSKEKPKDFLMKKAVFQAEKSPPNWNELERLLEEIFSKKLDPTEKGIKEQLNRLKAHPQNKKLPEVLNEDFTNSYQDWLGDIDLALNLVAGSSNEWKIISRPFLKKYIVENLQALERAISQAKLETDSVEDQVEFDRQKSRLKDNLRARYSQFTDAPIEPPSLH